MLVRQLLQFPSEAKVQWKQLRLNVDILIHLLVCCSLTFIYLMIVLGITITKLITIFKTETNHFASGWENKPFKLKYVYQ